MATWPHQYANQLPSCHIRIDDEMIDCSKFRDTHPGGAELLELYHNADATDVFYAFHSKRAIKMAKNMKSRPVSDKVATDPKKDKISEDFETLRRKLEKDGWFQRDWLLETTTVLFPCVALCVIGSLISYSYPLLATIMIGVGMQQAGWIGHDQGHGRGDTCASLNFFFGCMINGFSRQWWSHKHNTHHAFPNRLTVDSDIHNEPVLYLFFPDKKDDVWYRKYQHYYYPLAYSFLYVSWRMQSFRFALTTTKQYKTELPAILCSYVWLACLPLTVSVGSMLLGGLLVAIVVTANHQPEPMFEKTDKHNFVADQIISTRDVECPDPLTEYLFGGMQYQLEHHLFPFMPKYRYRKVRPIIAKFCEDHGMEFKCSGLIDIMQRNFETMKKYSA